MEAGFGVGTALRAVRGPLGERTPPDAYRVRGGADQVSNHEFTLIDTNEFCAF